MFRTLPGGGEFVAYLDALGEVDGQHCLIREDGKLRHRVFANTEAGFSQLSEWLKKNHVSQVHACLEATGTYSGFQGITRHNLADIYKDRWIQVAEFHDVQESLTLP